VIAASLAVTFAAVLTVARARGVEVGCRCFGSIDADRLSTTALARSLVLVGVSAPPTVLMLADAIAVSAVWITEPAAWAGVAIGTTILLSLALLEQVGSFERRRRILLAARK